MKKLCLLLAAFLVFFADAERMIASPQFPIAGLGDIRINEIAANPEVGGEWVEIILLADGQRSLANYTVSDAIGVIYTFSKDSIISQDEFLMASGWSNKLNNTGDSVVIKNPKGEIISESIDYPALEKGETWAFDGSQYQKTNSATPEAENVFPAPEKDPKEDAPSDEPTPAFPLPEHGEVFISEIVSNPQDGEGEWVEIRSEASDIRSLSGLSLWDEVGKIHSFSAEDIISPDEYVVVSGWGSKLNNTGDSVFLQNTSDEIIAEAVGFPALEKGESWLPEAEAKGVPTPGEENELVPEDDLEEPEESILPPDLEGIFPPQIDEIRITEIMSNPTNGEEWVELFSSAPETRHLGGMIFIDDVGDFFTIPIGTIIEPEEYLMVSGWSSKLNNSGDSLTVIDSAENESISRIVFPSLLKGVSWAWDGKAFVPTGSPTPSEQNVITEPSPSSGSGGSSSSGGSSGKTSLIKTAASMSSVGSDDIELIISEVMFRGKDEDFIELYCQKCDVDLGGIRVADDDLIFEFPENTRINTGEYILIHFDKEEDQQAFPEDNIHHFWGEKSGLTGTDETIFVIDSRGNAEDALCIANRSGGFSPGEREDIIHLIHQKVLTSTHPLTEEICFDSRKLKTDVSLVFTGKKTGFASHDFFWTKEMTPGRKNPRSPQMFQSEELVVHSAFRFSENHIGIAIRNTSHTRARLQDFSLRQGEEILSLPAKTIFPDEEIIIPIEYSSQLAIEILDHWENIIFSVEELAIKTFPETVGGIVVSEILPNPEGEDTGREFVELLCLRETCSTDEVFLFVNGESVVIPSEKWESGSYLPLHDVSLRNSDLTIELFDMVPKTQEIIIIPSAKDGKSFSRFGEDFLWATPSPEAQNVPDVPSAFSDADQDGISDTHELVLDMNPFVADSKDSSGYKLFSSYVRRASKLELVEKDGLQISGKTLPNAKVVVVLHSKKETFTAATDENGVFEIKAFPDIEPGFHHADLIITDGKNVFVEKEKAQIDLKKNPQGDWLKNVQISMVLPNPTGKDSQNEMIMLQNTEEKEGVIKGFLLSNGKTKKAIAEITLLPNQRKVLKGNDIPQLTNASGVIELIDSEENVLQSIPWNKAKEGQWFGPDAPVFIEKKNTSSPSKKSQKSSPSEEAASPVITYAEGRFASLKNGIMGLRDENSRLILYRIDSNILAESTLNSYLKTGQKIIITLQDGLVVQVEVIPSITQSLPPESVPQKDFCFILILLLAIFTAAAAPFVFRFFAMKKGD